MAGKVPTQALPGQDAEAPPAGVQERGGPGLVPAYGRRADRRFGQPLHP